MTWCHYSTGLSEGSMSHRTLILNSRSPHLVVHVRYCRKERRHTIFKFQVTPFSRNYSMVLSEGSTSHDFDFEDDDDDEEDDIADGKRKLHDPKKVN